MCRQLKWQKQFYMWENNFCKEVTDDKIR